MESEGSVRAGGIWLPASAVTLRQTEPVRDRIQTPGLTEAMW